MLYLCVSPNTCCGFVTAELLEMTDQQHFLSLPQLSCCSLGEGFMLPLPYLSSPKPLSQDWMAEGLWQQATTPHFLKSSFSLFLLPCLPLCLSIGISTGLPSRQRKYTLRDQQSQDNKEMRKTPLNVEFDFFFFNLFIYLFWLCWVFVSVRGLSLVAASGVHSSWATLHRSARASLTIAASLVGSTASRRAGSVVVARGPSCSTACGILPDQGSNPCPLHWQADSQPLRHQGSPEFDFFKVWKVIVGEISFF